jgi:putative flippase GtrA
MMTGTLRRYKHVTDQRPPITETRRIVSFAAVGVAGFVVDAGTLYLGVALGAGLRLGRVFSYLAAMTTTWALNRRLTFADRTSPGLLAEWLRYGVSQLGGAAVNLGIYYALIAGSALVARHPVLGVAAGSLAGLAVNYLVARLLVFRHRDGEAPAQRGNASARLGDALFAYGPPFLLLLAPALYNGFPLVFSDSGTYLRIAIEMYGWWDRPFYYSFFLYPLHLRLTLWPIVLAQDALTLAVAALFVRQCLGRIPPLHLTLLLCLFAALTSIAVVADQVMPDVFTALMLLCICTLVFFADSLSRAQRVFLGLVLLGSVCFHQANFLIALLTLAAAYACRSLALGRVSGLREFALPALLVVLGLALMVAPNYVFFRKPVVSRGSAVFLLAKLIDDGVALDYLQAACPRQAYSICPELPAIRDYREHRTAQQDSTSDYVLWGPPLAAAGGYGTVATYAGAVNNAAIRHEPLQFLRASARSFGEQLVSFRTGDGLFRYGPDKSVTQAIARYFPARVNLAYERSRQQRGTLSFAALSTVHAVVVAASVVVIVLLLFADSTGAVLAGLTGTLLAALAGNALVTGALSTVHDRYQSRVTCVLPLLAMVLAYRWYRARAAARVARS